MEKDVANEKELLMILQSWQSLIIGYNERLCDIETALSKIYPMDALAPFTGPPEELLKGEDVVKKFKIELFNMKFQYHRLSLIVKTLNELI